MSYTDKALQRAREFLKKKEYDALLVTSREGNRFFSGFTGSDSTLIVTETGGEDTLLTDSRYTEQASKQCPGFKIVEYKRVTEAVSKRAKELGLARIAFESRHLSYNLYHRYVEALDGRALLPQERAIDLLRVKKFPEEMVEIEAAIAIAEGALEKCLPELKPGMKESEFAMILEFEMRRRGSGPIPFETIVASGPRGALPHGVASDRVMKKNELVTIDFGSNYRGYMCDNTVTVGLGNPSPELREIYQIVKDSHDMAIEAIAAGKSLKEVDSVARKHIDKKGFGKYFGHGLGHGVGLAVHEEPSLSPLADGELDEGAVVTVEPGIYMPELGGVRIEDMVYVGREGARVLTKYSKDFATL